MMENFIITIGRQAGSGGREIGMRLAQRLGIPYYGRQELMEIAKERRITKRSSPFTKNSQWTTCCTPLQPAM